MKKTLCTLLMCALCAVMPCGCSCTEPSTSVPASQPSADPKAAAQAAFEDFLTASPLAIDQYAFWDLTGDGVPELLYFEAFTLSAYTYRGKAVEPLPVWEHNAMNGPIEILQNGALLFKHISTGTEYRYQTFTDNGASETLSFGFIEGSIEDYRFDGRQVSYQEWCSLVHPYLEVPEAVLEWHPYLPLMYRAAQEAFAEFPEKHRDVGELGSETQQMVLLNGKYYQSYVSSTADIRYILIAAEEYPLENPTWTWDWVAIGTAKDYSLDKIGTVDEGYKD